jgi:glycosyltransferase involved in cell wall biosynthesis
MCLQQMVEMLLPGFDLSVYARRQVEGVPTTTVPPSSIGWALGSVRGLRGRRDWQVWITDTHFDRSVARQLVDAEIFQGATGQCLRSLMRAKSLDMRTAVDSVTQHIDVFSSEAQTECERFGVNFPVHQRLVRRMREEYAQADIIRTMSERARQTFLERGVDPSRVISAHPPYDVRQFPIADFSHAPFRICYVGALEPWKGFHFLIDAFEQLRLPDSELMLWGSTGSRAMAAYVRAAIRRVPNLRIQSIDMDESSYDRVYGSANVLVHPSVSEGFAHVVAEAMACGLPVVVTEATGAADLVRDGENGFIVPTRDPAAIADRVALLAESEALVRRMGRAARQTVEDRLGLASCSEHYVSRLQALL